MMNRAHRRLRITILKAAGAAAMLVAAGAATAQVRNPASAHEAHKMLTSHEALNLAHTAIRDIPGREDPGDIIVEPKYQHYQVTFRFLTAGAKPSLHIVQVLIDAETGSAFKKEDLGYIPVPADRLVPPGAEKFLSGKKAYDLAIGALEGFNEYDHHGRLTVELQKDCYYVTFPIIQREGGGGRGPDYAVQVWIDARSGKKLKVLVAS